MTCSIILVDQLTKQWVATTFVAAESRPMIPHVFHFTYVRNTGGAFGLFQGWVPLLIVASVVAIGLVIWVGAKPADASSRHGLQYYALPLIVAGAIGNLIDRIRFGYVVDFLDFRVWPVFNVADIAITCGVGLLLLDMLTLRRRIKQRELVS